MNLKETLSILCEPVGVAGCEFPASNAARELLLKYAPNAEVDKFGNVVGTIMFDENLPVLLLDAHIDEIGMIVNFIDENGFLKVSGAGGIDTRGLPAQMVTVWGKKPVKGVVCALPPHVKKDEGKALNADEISIDCGFTKESAQELISLGDVVTIDAEFAELQGGKVTSRALDDRAGVAAILYALDLIKTRKVNFNLAILFSAQEELGCRGAVISAFNIAPNLSISVDVSYGNYPGSPENKTWKLGAGVMVGNSPVLDKTLYSKLVNIAKNKNIPCQVEVMGGKTGTTADVISIARTGVKCGLLSIPLRNMHTAAELVQLSDIEATGKLISEFIMGEIV
ncbi:MAG: M20/M25/M40 family metallo-hydrolase [Oscillospiraceae bacterium]|nr:M20/M25/M40 family metallo-hydrolase [Oscillospiraceae bacterium]